MKNFTIIPNELLNDSDLPIQVRYLYCVLLRHCGQSEHCFPSQKTLAKTLACSDRYVRDMIGVLIDAGLVSKVRRGWNRSNTYTVSKSLLLERNGSSYHIRSKFPLQHGTTVPTINTYLQGKGKRSLKGLERMGEALKEKGIL